MNEQILMGSQVVSVSFKLIAGIFLFLKWKQYRRQSLLLWAMFFLSSGLAIASDALGVSHGIPLAQALGVSFLASGVITFLDEEAIGFPMTFLKRVAFVLPLIFSVYILIYVSYSESLDFQNPLYLIYGIEGIFYAFSGIILLSARRVYPKTGSLLGVAIALHGFHKMDYPFLRPVEWFAPIGFTLGTILSILEVVTFVKIAMSERFRNVDKLELGIIKSGVFIVPTKDLKRYIEALKDFPVLVFARRDDFPDIWEVHSLTTIEGPGRIGPTQLHRIIDRVHSYLAEAKQSNVTGVVILDGLEYLLMYNDSRSVMKFLATLSDYVTLYGGMLILVLDEKSLDEKQLKTLRQIINMGGIK